MHSVFSVAFANTSELLRFSGLAASIPVDFFVKSTGMGHINKTLTEQLPIATDSVAEPVVARALYLNCLSFDS